MEDKQTEQTADKGTAELRLALERATDALRSIAAFGFANPGRGYTCAKMATTALAEVKGQTK